MITKHLAILLGVVLLGLSAVFAIPHHDGIGKAGIAMVLPANVGGWTGSNAPVTPEELTGLAPDTSFERRFYTNAVGDKMYVSIVLSGTDMANSIHRPERCLVAQGWTPEQSQRVRVPLDSGGAPLEITKLTVEQEVRTKDNHPLSLRNLNYYWFIGSHDITASHWRRTFIDIKDRILYGENQRWAYVTVATRITDNLKPGGLNAQDSAETVERFIGQLVPQFQKP